MPVCRDACDPPCSYGCALRQKGVSVKPSAMPSRMNAKPPRKADPAWERGIVSETRVDGSRMPLLAPGTRHPLRVHEYAQKRRDIDAQVRNLKTRPEALPS